jgi:hypothetical protein
MTAEQPHSGGDQDQTLVQIAAVIATMGGGHTIEGDVSVASGEDAPAVELPPLRGRLEKPDRPRWSSSASTETLTSAKGDYDHQFWLPEKRADGSEEPGHLRVVAYLDEQGRVARYGNAFDRYHYRTAAALTDLKLAGFGPVLEQLGFTSLCTVSDRYWDRHCIIRVDYPSAATLCQRANQLLAEQAARTGREPLELVNVPAGQYDGNFFVDMIAKRKYPISTEYDTPKQETDLVEHGSHDVLTHAAAAIILSATTQFDDLVRRARKLSLPPGSTMPRKRSEIRYFMGAADRGINVQTLTGMLDGDREALLTFSQVFPGGQSSRCLEEIRQQIANPREAGWLPT